MKTNIYKKLSAIFFSAILILNMNVKADEDKEKDNKCTIAQNHAVKIMVESKTNKQRNNELKALARKYPKCVCEIISAAIEHSNKTQADINDITFSVAKGAPESFEQILKCSPRFSILLLHQDSMKYGFYNTLHRTLPSANTGVVGKVGAFSASTRAALIDIDLNIDEGESSVSDRMLFGDSVPSEVSLDSLEEIIEKLDVDEYEMLRDKGISITEIAKANHYGVLDKIVDAAEDGDSENQIETIIDSAEAASTTSTTTTTTVETGIGGLSLESETKLRAIGLSTEDINEAFDNGTINRVIYALYNRGDTDEAIYQDIIYDSTPAADDDDDDDPATPDGS